MKALLAAAFAAAAFVTTGANAMPVLKVGAYSADGLQTICLYKDGTWNSSTFASWGGLWTIVNGEGHIFGNYASGAGNDSIVVTSTGGSWTEWSDSLSYYNPIDPITFTKMGSLKAGGCSETDSRAPSSNLPPQQAGRK